MNFAAHLCDSHVVASLVKTTHCIEFTKEFSIGVRIYIHTNQSHTAVRWHPSQNGGHRNCIAHILQAESGDVSITGHSKIRDCRLVADGQVGNRFR